MDSLVSVPALTGHTQTRADRLRPAALAYLTRYKGQSRDHAASGLRGYLSWCAERGVDPLAATRVEIELGVRWMQETRGLRPATVSRRVSIIAGFYEGAHEWSVEAEIAVRCDHPGDCGMHRIEFREAPNLDTSADAVAALDEFTDWLLQRSREVPAERWRGADPLAAND